MFIQGIRFRLSPTFKSSPLWWNKSINLSSRCWVVLKDGRSAYIDHYKSDGTFGVRPVTEKGDHFLNPAEHWPEDKRIEIPEEYALTLRDFRPAEVHEIPPKHRK